MTASETEASTTIPESSTHTTDNLDFRGGYTTTNALKDSSSSSSGTPTPSPREVNSTSGKVTKPTKGVGKYRKEEIDIKNSDFTKEYTRPLIIKSPITWDTTRYLYPPHFNRSSYQSQQFWSSNQDSMMFRGAKERYICMGPYEAEYGRKLLEDQTTYCNGTLVPDDSEKSYHRKSSSSSPNSTASDDSNCVMQPNLKQSSVLNNFVNSDLNPREYKYHIKLGQHTVMVSGNDYDTVRNARTVLKEFYNIWLQKSFIGDCGMFGNPQDIAFRFNSIDSSITGLDHALSYQAMYPAQGERRPVLGRSDSTPPSPTDSDENQNGTNKKYNRNFLLSCASSEQSQAKPPNWDQIISECPDIAKKVPLLDLPPPFCMYPDAWPYMNSY